MIYNMYRIAQEQEKEQEQLIVANQFASQEILPISMMRATSQDMNAKLNEEIEQLTTQYEAKIDEYEEQKIQELNELKDDLKDKVRSEAENQSDMSYIRSIKRDLQNENDIKLRQLKRDLTNEMNKDLKSYKSEIELKSEDFKDPINQEHEYLLDQLKSVHQIKTEEIEFKYEKTLEHENKLAQKEIDDLLALEKAKSEEMQANLKFEISEEELSKIRHEKQPSIEKEFKSKLNQERQKLELS